MSQELISDQKLRKQFTKYVSLAVLSMIGQSLFILADTFFVANGVGPTGLAALNIVLPIINVINGIGWMIGVGGATQYTIAKSRKNDKRAKEIFSHSISLALALSVLLTVILTAFSEPILRFLGATPELFAMSKSYFMIVSSFSPFFILNNTVITFLRNDNNPNTAMASMLVGGFFNIVFDYIFIFPLDMGLQGAAIATVFSPLISLIVSITHFKSKKNGLHFESFRLKFQETLRTIQIGFSSFLNEFSSAVVMFLFNIFILRYAGEIGVSAYSIVANMNIVAIAIFTGIGQGFQPLVSLYHGQKGGRQVKKLFKYGLVLSFAVGVLFNIVSLSMSEEIVAVFNSQDNTRLQMLAEPALKMYFTSFLFTGVNFASIYFLSAVGQGKESLFISLLRGMLLIYPILALMASGLGLNGVWLTMTVVEILTLSAAAFILYRYFSQVETQEEVKVS